LSPLSPVRGALEPFRVGSLGSWPVAFDTNEKHGPCSGVWKQGLFGGPPSARPLAGTLARALEKPSRQAPCFGLFGGHWPLFGTAVAT